MAQTRKKRVKKHRGTQAGSIDTRKKSRPKSRAEAKSQVKSRKSSRTGPSRLERPPSWRGAAIRGIIASVVFVALLMLLFGRSFTEALPIGLFMLVFYIPAGYYMDSIMWKRRERARIRAGLKK